MSNKINAVNKNIESQVVFSSKLKGSERGTLEDKKEVHDIW